MIHEAVPDTTSAEAFSRYIGGKCLYASSGEVWREIKAWVIVPPRVADTLPLPAVSEPFLVWAMSGEAEFQEREYRRPWSKHRIRPGSLFLTTGGAPYECCWETVSREPMETLLVFLELPLLRRALEEVHGPAAARARLRDDSAFTDAALMALLSQLHGELLRRKASPLFVQGIAQAISIHLARHYSVLDGRGRGARPALPGHQLRRVTDWMAEHVAEDYDLAKLAAMVGISKFHFHRLFKAATGVSPARHHLDLRMVLAKRLLRETKRSVVEIALETGYANPSHFTRLFRRETGSAPSDYRRER